MSYYKISWDSVAPSNEFLLEVRADLVQMPPRGGLSETAAILKYCEDFKEEETS